MASLEIILWPQGFKSPMQFCQISNFESQIQFSQKSCHWILRQLSHTLENFEFNSPPLPFQLIPWHTRHTITCQFIPPIFSDTIERIRSKFPHPIPLVLFFSRSSFLQIYLISILPLSRKFSFSLLNTNNVNLTQFLFPFWNSVLTNMALLTLIS